MMPRRLTPVIKTASEDDCEALGRLIRDAYRDVALRFSLTAENCPKHPSNCTGDWVHSDLERGVVYYHLANGDKLMGCVALETTDQAVAYLTRLAVLPEYRRRGLGKQLVQHIIDQACQQDMQTISIGLIAAQKELIDLYQSLDFIPGGTKRFAHLPFMVRFMAYAMLTDK